MSNNTEFCRLMLADARTQSKQAGVNIPKNLSCYIHTTGKNKYIEVSAPKLGIVWSGRASCAYEAKTRYIFDLIENHLNSRETITQTTDNP